MTISSLSNSYSNYTQSTSTADRATQLLSDLDTDKDGKVSEGEFSAFGQLMNAQGPMGPPPSQSASVSSSTTSSVSATQGATSSQSVFATIDANADGSLSLDELTSMVAQADTQAAGMHGSLNAHSTSSGGTTSSSSSTNATDTLSSLFSSADTNGDGSLSLDEFASKLSQADKQAAGAHRPPPPPPPNATASTSGSNGTSSSDGTSSSSSTTSSSSSTNATDTLSSLFSSADTNGDNVLNVDELSALIAQLQANLKTNTG